MNIYIVFILGVILGVLGTTSVLFYKYIKELKSQLDFFREDEVGENYEVESEDANIISYEDENIEINNLEEVNNNYNGECIRLFNLFYGVGRIAEDPILEIDENGRLFYKIKVLIPRSYKNEQGIYENDEISCKLDGNIATQTFEYCKKDTLVGIKGKFVTAKKGEDTEMYVLSEKISILTTTQEVAKNVGQEEIEM